MQAPQRAFSPGQFRLSGDGTIYWKDVTLITAMPQTRSAETGLSDAEFLADLRLTVERYLETIDAWEAAYAKSYRIVVAGQLSEDLKPCQEEYSAARRRLEAMVPRATRLCRKAGVREPWVAILRVELGASPPQDPAWTSAVGRGERSQVTKCLLDLETRVIESRREPAYQPGKSPPPLGILRRIRDWFI